MNVALINARARTLAIWGLIGLGFALPLPTAWANLMLLITLSGWLGSGHWQEKWRVLKQAPAARATALFIAIVLLGLLYGEAGYGKHYLTKYASLLLLPIVLTLQLNEHEKWQALGAFCSAMVLTLALSLMVWLGWLPTTLLNETSADNPIVFKLHITHGFFMILAAFFMYVGALHLRDSRYRLPLLILVVLALVNALLMVKGRTGQLAMLALLVYLFHLRFPRYGLLSGVIAAAVLAVTAYAVSPAFKERTDIAVTEATQWQSTRGDRTSSIGMRFDYYSTTLSIIQQHPLTGVGTGGFPQAYDKAIAGSQLPPSNNPHNQYLLTTAQYGLIGLFVLLGFYIACGRQAMQLAAPFSILAGGVLLAYLVGNLFNSFMLDFSERLFFAWSLGLLLSRRDSAQLR